jgi:hypothetical protein
MNFIEASQRFEKFRRKGWEATYWYWAEGYLKRNSYLHRKEIGYSEGPVNFVTNTNFLANDWEEWQEPQQTYTFLEACKKFGKIKRKAWGSEASFSKAHIIVFKDGSIAVCGCMGASSGETSIDNIDLRSIDWIEYKE